jgi:hypothetical protein
VSRKTRAVRSDVLNAGLLNLKKGRAVKSGAQPKASSSSAKSCQIVVAQREATTSARTVKSCRLLLTFQSCEEKMEAVYSSEKLVTIYQTTWQHIPEDSELHSPCKHIISHIHINQYNIITIYFLKIWHM